MISLRKVDKLILKSGLSVKSISFLGSGDDSYVFLADNLYVIKIPKRHEVKISQAREFALYDYLKDFSFDYTIPKVIYKSNDMNVMSYIEGEHISLKQYLEFSEKEKDALAYDEARFLHQLHSVEIDYTNPLFITTIQDKKEAYIKDHDLLISILKNKKLLNIKVLESIDKIYEILLSKNYLYDYSQCLTHNDFSSDNMIFINKRLVGVIDFGDFVVGDPDNDFLYLLDNSNNDFGKDFGRRVLKYYGHKYPEIAERKAELNDLYYPFQQIILAYTRNEFSQLMRHYYHLLNTDVIKFID